MMTSKKQKTVTIKNTATNGVAINVQGIGPVDPGGTFEVPEDMASSYLNAQFILASSSKSAGKAKAKPQTTAKKTKKEN